MNPRTPGKPLIHALTQAQGYSCSYTDPVTKRRCSSQFALEIDHTNAWSHGGQTELSNLRYLCRAHHARISFLAFGDRRKFVEIAKANNIRSRYAQHRLTFQLHPDIRR